MVRWFDAPRSASESAVRTGQARAVNLARDTAELMGRIAEQRADRARSYRVLADGCSDDNGRRLLLERAQVLDGLAERARRFAAEEIRQAELFS
jgi:hypothetical protein